MAEIVSIIGITHNPFMPRLFKQPQQPPGGPNLPGRQRPLPPFAPAISRAAPRFHPRGEPCAALIHGMSLA